MAKRAMDDSERLAEEYLRSLNQGTVEYHPDGDVTPDFLLGGRIAVEVRRLNQNFVSPAGDYEGLEKFSESVSQSLKNLLPSLGQSIDGESWFVTIDFRRPLERWKSVRPKIQSNIRSELKSFKNRSRREPTTLFISKHFNLDLLRASRDHGSFFVLAGCIDYDSGGFVLHEIIKNVKLCVAEKERKIAPHRNRYSEWWLVLADHISDGLDDFEQAVLRDHVATTSFAKVVLIGRNHRRALEI